MILPAKFLSICPWRFGEIIFGVVFQCYSTKLAQASSIKHGMMHSLIIGDRPFDYY